jgi:DNA-binding response OmpR family regulator
MSQLEFDLLLYLSQNKWKTVSKEELLEKVWWEYDAFNMTRTVDVYIWYVRKKLGKDVILTKRGAGYIIP